MTRMHPNGLDRKRALRAPSVIQYAEYSETSDLFNIGGARFPPSRFFDVVEAFGYDYEQTHGSLAIGRALYAAARMPHAARSGTQERPPAPIPEKGRSDR